LASLGTLPSKRHAVDLLRTAAVLIEHLHCGSTFRSDKILHPLSIHHLGPLTPYPLQQRLINRHDESGGTYFPQAHWGLLEKIL
jgi:hypothetical protein